MEISPPRREQLFKKKTSDLADSLQGSAIVIDEDEVQIDPDGIPEEEDVFGHTQQPL